MARNTARCAGPLGFFVVDMGVWFWLVSPARYGARAKNWTFWTNVQGKSDKNAKFLNRWECLRVRTGLKTVQLCGFADISRSLFYAIRDGSREPTGKLFAKLEAAERAAGIVPAPVRAAESEAKANDVGAAADHFPDSGKLMGNGELVAILRGEIAEKNRQIERLLGLLERAEIAKGGDRV